MKCVVGEKIVTEAHTNLLPARLKYLETPARMLPRRSWRAGGREFAAERRI